MKNPTVEGSAHEAMPYQDVRIDSIEVPYEGTELPGYFVHARWAKGPSPTILYINGADSLSEEAYFTVGLPAANAGYNCLLFNAPGVGLTLYQKGLTTRVDSEHFVSPAVDYLLTRPEVDKGRICLAGESFAAYLVPRAAAFEKRIAAAVSWGATYDWGNLWRHETRPMFVTPHMITLFGAKDAEDYLQKRSQHHLRGMLEKVTCPFLVLVGAEDWIPQPASQGLRYMQELGSTIKVLKVIESDLGGVAHCQKDNLHALHAETFNWLNTVLDYRPGPE